MAESLVFNTRAFSAVSQWLEQPTSSKDTQHEAQEESSKMPAPASNWRHKRAGLGLEAKKTKDKEAKVEGSVGTLQKLLLGKGKKSKRQREQEEDDAAATKRQQKEEDDEDDDGELADSKARIFVASTKPPLGSTIAGVQTEDPKKKRRKKKKKGIVSNAEGQDTAGQASAPAPPSNRIHTIEARSTASESLFQKPKPQEEQHPGGQEEASEPRRQKRTKKRSKQKNIRRDKRSIGQRPAHLQEGHESFTGRAMTDETRRHLGLPVAAIPIPAADVK